jgi:hypothetical protein
MDDVLIARTTEGATVAEVDLDGTSMSVSEIVAEARRHGAALVWAHGGRPGGGFVAGPGYAHLHADDPVAGELLAPVDPEDYGPLLAASYLGQWGHKWVDPDVQPPTDGSVVLCLRDEDEPIGLCRVWPDQRLVDQPGVVPARRSVENTLRLLGAACALLGPGLPAPCSARGRWTSTAGVSLPRCSRRAPGSASP